MLEERLGGDFLPETRAGDSEIIEGRMVAWRKNCAIGDDDLLLVCVFHRRTSSPFRSQNKKTPDYLRIG